MTNHERIKQMTVEELAEFIDDRVSDCDGCPARVECKLAERCDKVMEIWLNSEVTE